ncbi:hypothetical protein DACRYDRAFT_103086 [Dacryopinax primogenitus]|uniref:Mediator of RNA polymerase II transcription subunit 11 n=1 Tax=Dacryopinax primogenitus (strain DJM 731) TaxID=1858805 RepID=M5GGV3_DACPD|nr:uncharacterized protein DACRYDRAFT_103086 [Dacryopinax primogenitus]EJU06138.1 hypothetical protein DACRYDRAFT_103086 [Dacryopinax primogenitus]
MEGSAPVPTSVASQQLEALNGVEEDIAQSLRLASAAMSLLTLPIPIPEGEEQLPNENPEADPEERERRLEEVLEQYFQLIDNVHISIRTTLATLRAQRVSPALLMDSTGREPPTYGASIPSEDEVPGEEKDEDKLGLYEKRMARDAWQHVVKAMAELRLARRRAPESNGVVELEEQPP